MKKKAFSATFFISKLSFQDSNRTAIYSLYDVLKYLSLKDFLAIILYYTFNNNVFFISIKLSYIAGRKRKVVSIGISAPTVLKMSGNSPEK